MTENNLKNELNDTELDQVSGGKFQAGTPAEELWTKIGVKPKNKKTKGKLDPDNQATVW